ncbi:radial spoke head 1 [Acrasis kona]|uniref:Radial spoke head 1 n=1 Tax=Acrasis kona TaxID=1008807 RepID=A0AAW2ZNC4_9EUKA
MSKAKPAGKQSRGKDKGNLEEVEPVITKGTGIFMYSEDIRYDGEWMLVDNVKVKHGIGTYAEGQNIYEGSFENDLVHGKGKMTFQSGAQYEGDINKGKFEGHGTYLWPDKSCYVGEWRDNRMHGQGTFTSVDGKVWQGAFYNGTGEGMQRELKL